jgi:hypothetical protein
MIGSAGTRTLVPMIIIENTNTTNILVFINVEASSLASIIIIV